MVPNPTTTTELIDTGEKRDLLGRRRTPVERRRDRNYDGIERVAGDDVQNLDRLGRRVLNQFGVVTGRSLQALLLELLLV